MVKTSVNYFLHEHHLMVFFPYWRKPFFIIGMQTFKKIHLAGEKVHCLIIFLLLEL